MKPLGEINPYVAYIFWVLIEARLDELFEGFRVAACQLRGVVLGDEEEHPHGVQLGVGGLALGQLDGGDAERPDVRLAVVTRLLDDFRRHPEWRADKCVPFACCVS